MKKAIKIITIVAFLMTAPLFLLAQNPPHPNGGATPNSTTNTPVGGGAPIDGGLIMLIAMGSAYGAKKVWNYKK